MNDKTLIAYDRDGQICKRGDILYDKKGYKYIFVGIRYVEPKSFFERFVSVGKAGHKAIIRLCRSEKNDYSDIIFVELELVRKWYSHNKFDKSISGER